MLMSISTFKFIFCFFFFNAPAPTEIYTLSLHDALPISLLFSVVPLVALWAMVRYGPLRSRWWQRSEEHTSELQSRENLVCRLLLEKKKNNYRRSITQSCTTYAARLLPVTPSHAPA